MRANFILHRDVTVCVITLYNRAHVKMYTTKKLNGELDMMNELSNNLKRKEFVEAVQNEEENGKSTCFLEGTLDVLSWERKLL